MELGLLVNTEERLNQLLGLTNSALRKGHTVRMFIMDSATCLLEKDELTSLCENENVLISFCEYNAKQHKIDFDQLDRRIKRGTQLNNAIMCQKADKMLVL